MRTVLITGASTGIGKATALRLARSGWDVLAGVRNTAAGEALVTQAGAGGRLTPVQLDITDTAQIAAAAELVAQRTGAGGLDALVNNAGIAVGGPLELLPMEELRELMEVNFFGQVAVTQALIPALRKAHTPPSTPRRGGQAGGRIVLLSSIGGLVTTPYMAPYHASKYALEAVGNALRVELRRSHIQVALIEPGSVATPIWDKGNELIDGVEVPAELEEFYGHVPKAMEKTLSDTAKRGVPPERVAQTIEGALKAKRMRARYLIGLDAHAMVWASRLLPDLLFDRILRRAVGV
ncbi:MAG TPA: SDR family oxidoreductase [Solirubrobacteraceae bacterium]|jgi:NAD(P)-dependent dehydrogenase (short-subunit alcohol dehydrogenase family)